MSALRTIDRTFGWLLVVSALLHALGSWKAYHDAPTSLVWALSGSLAALLVAALNLLRVGRPSDRPLATISLLACLAWIAVCIGFGLSLGNLLDPRPVIHGVITIVLAGFSARTLANG